MTIEEHEAHAAERAHATEADFRLPRTVIPERYRIVIEPDLGTGAFVGEVDIHVVVASPTASVVLNAVDLDVLDAEVVVDGVGSPAEAHLDPDSQRLVLSLDEEVPAGPATVSIRYTGALNDQLRGFYRSTYVDDAGDEHVIATTQFESTDARRAFPCWDEPDLKATFTVSLVVDGDLMAVSNAAEVARTRLDDGRVRVDFAETVRMSTYLVAFVVGELEATSPVHVDGTPLRIVTPPGKLHLTDFALEAGAFALDFFASYYDVPYPGDKLDMVAVPDFGFGAMENLGCIIYRETALLVDEATATQAELARVASVIAHEIAHMWFGDLVTMKWWNGVWLNEAFATFAENTCTAAFRPDWKYWLAFATDRATSQETDALGATRPIEFPVASPSEADAMFDVLTYEKGSSVLRMMEQYLSEEVFREGVSLYLKRHAFSNTSNEDLWRALEEVSGEPVGDIMDTWIFQGGYPVLDVVLDGDDVVVSQRPFRFLGGGEGSWQVPVLYRSSEGDGRVVVGDEPVTLEVGDDLVVDAGGDGFYRVAYSPELLASIVDRLSDLDAVERYSVVSDALAGMLAGTISSGEYLELVRHLAHEGESEVWQIALAGIDELDRIVSSDDRELLRRFVRDLVGPTAEEFGWLAQPGESDRERALRGQLLRALGNLGDDPATIEEAGRIEAADGDVDAEVADAALSIVAAHGDLEDFERFVARSKAAPTPQKMIKYLRAAASVPHPEVPRRLTDMILAGDVRSQDSFWVLAVLIGQRDTGVRAWQLVTERWDDLMAVLPPAHRYRILDHLRYRSEPEIAASLRDWFAEHPIPGADKAVSQKLEMVDVRSGLRRRESERIGDALA
jgi:puromycin-sensitive aminopeptidase